MSRKILYLSPNLKIFRNGPWRELRDTVAVCFQYLQPEQQLNLPGFAEQFFDKYQIDAVFVNCATNEWYQYSDLSEALSILRVFTSGWRRTITYGSSMGGYAAIRFASAIGAQSSIAIGPQYSPRSLVIPEEQRYDALIAKTAFLYEDTYQACSSVDNYVVFDPLSKVDTRHVQAYKATARLLPIPIPCGGHTPTIALTQCGMLSEFILHLLAGDFSMRDFRTAFRRARTSSSEYLKELQSQLIEHRRPETARRIGELFPAIQQHAATTKPGQT